MDLFRFSNSLFNRNKISDTIWMSKTRVEKWFVGGEVSISSKTRSEERSRLRREGQFEEQWIP